MTRSILFLALVLSVPMSASAKVLWKGDFETANILQWSKAQMVSPDRLQVQTTRVKQGKYAVRALVKQGDDPINSGGNRNELLDVTYQPEGAERWYHWYTYFDESYPSAKKWQVFTQWHQYEDFGSPPIEFDVYGEEMHLTNWQNVIWRAPLVRGKWRSFLFHVKWSKDAKVGFLELWLDGEQVIPKTYLMTDSRVYLKQGLYRNSDIAPDGIVFHDGMTVGETRADVEPVSVVPPDEEVDAGSPKDADAGTPDPVTDAGTPDPDPDPTDPDPTDPNPVDGGLPLDPNWNAPIDPILPEPQMGCSVAGGVGLPLAALALAALALRRRRRQS